MTKGTHSMGKKAKGTSHYRCRRCGRPSFHRSKRVCSHCGYGRSSRLRKYSWQKNK